MRGGRSLVAVVAAAVFVSGAPAAAPPAWSTYGADPGRAGAAAAPLAPPVKPAFVLPLQGRVTSQVLAARDVPAPGLTTLYVATSAGIVYAVSETGYVRWRADLGQLATDCAQLDGYGVTGTGVIDPDTSTLYVADALGRLHALDLATGAEREGWPVRLYGNPVREHVWGALALVGSRVYAATGSYCDFAPFQGRLIAVDTLTRRVSTWISVPAGLGGGGGIWGWGGIAYSPTLDRLFVATGNAFPGGTNRGANFSESAGYGENVVALSPDLKVAGASHPTSINKPLDLDFVGSPVVFDRPGCGELVVAHDKNGQLFGWRADNLAAGPLWTINLEQFDPNNPLLSQLAYDPARRALFAITGAHGVRVDIAPDCSAKVVWSQELGTDSLNGSPTVAGGTVWYARSDNGRLAAVDAVTGAQRASFSLPGLTLAAPTILDGRIFVGTFTGQLVAFAAPDAPPVHPGPEAPRLPGHASWFDAAHGWVSRETGVWSTDDGGRHWRQIFDQPATTVVRTSITTGIIRVPTSPPGCTCGYNLWTTDGGLHWRASRAIAGALVGRDSGLYWLAPDGLEIRQVTPWPPVDGTIRSRTVAAVDKGQIVALTLVPGGAAALVKAPNGRAASVVIVRPDQENELHALPRPPGVLISQSLRTSAGALVVDGTVFRNGATQRVRWTSADGGKAWEPLPAS